MRGTKSAVVSILAIGLLAGPAVGVAAQDGDDGTAGPSESPTSPSPTPSIQDVMALQPFSSLTPGRYFIDPDGDASTALRVVFRVPGDGWSAWIGAAKFSDVGHSGMSVTTVANLVRDGCSDHSWADPPVGPTVDDLVAALSDLAPFEVTSPPKDVIVDGYRGKHLEWIVPDPPEGAGDSRPLSGCIGGQLKSWVGFIDTSSPGDAFYGYTGPGYREEFWVLDVEGTRLMIAAESSRGTPANDLAERQEMIESIRIEP